MHEFGHDTVAKVPRPDTPEAWIRIEADFTAAVREAGAPVPEFLGFGEHQGRTVGIYRRAFGELMWDAVLARPDRVEEYARRLVELQTHFASLVPPILLPALLDRLRSKIRIAARFVDAGLEPILDEIPAVRRIVLCHGDLHPGNVILGADGPVVVDWFDAARGDPVADVARSVVLLADESAGAHLVGAGRELLAALRAAYLRAASEAFGFDAVTLERWRVVAVAARAAEALPVEVLREVW